MKTWSKYIILIITIFAIFLCKGETISPKENHITFIEQFEDETENLSNDEFDFGTARPSHFSSVQCLQKNPHRRDNTQRQIISFLKINKMFDLHASVLIINKSTHKNSTLSEPSHRLIRLGKLVI